MVQIKAILTIVLLAIVSVVLIPLQWCAVKFGLSIQRRLPLVWHRLALGLVGIRVRQIGKPCERRPLLIASNHASWVDITVIGSLMPLSFIAKSEVAGWPVFGLFAKLQRSVFVNRTKRSDTGKVADTIAGRLKSGDAMVLFAEGTSNDGNVVLPFRSALLGSATRALDADGGDVWVQPLSIAYQGIHGLPMGRQFRPGVAWYGDMELAGHLWGVFVNGALDVIVTWGEPTLVHHETDRKALTVQMENQVRSMTVAALTGAAVKSACDLENSGGNLFSNAEKTSKAGAEKSAA
ncbi:lyso-ornithine lipid acyltransferase [Roseibium hamelinense]|uniref:Lyso-ornithine lipid acyltransferase n=1 Tax=Roseibium hamelinense TaxID=150831 RepID=A0A562T1W4_9HYPH|nr:lysophospholipid acyltransferase family protein [Roseibium hamelinense]MTI44674.1 1-acyl-sn-glycerol-3-phosphate acyltransferase [Roseibium hamelinense]TWI87303.1 lyso-ornithine lipid acyltransferase [Roseibium hamelinense]